ncbi:class I SAM-dependent methyltransferase [Yinghuangia sp. ASG 101]|uniref:class I SAM-dependent methyltransferase n=1 Tax=Yinghuangia sp. ASG 101 TaxID=2896848 RepID=UPI001E325A97|nr:class I SAM-dependent methyltransferase [Yinghuangia sp. ASG 101]UGQ14897.1 class I SAM-dependent methyltransferase [Yinghuangia sp. ASG 101]
MVSRGVSSVGATSGVRRRVPAARKPAGVVTRGTTNPNRLRRVDRWIAAEHARLLRAAPDPLVVDLGYGASPVTTVEFHRRLRAVRPGVETLGIEIDPERVAAALPYAGDGLSFVRGGFEVPLPDARRPVLIRAFNVLRQYGEDDVARAWSAMCAQLAPGGLLVEGTCDEPGRLATWVAVGADARPRTLTLAARLAGLGRPSDLAVRLPKALIHRNVPGEPVHAFLSAFDRAWDTHAALAPLGVRQRWAASVRALAAEWPVRTRPTRARGGEVTVDWAAVAPSGPSA